jgi:hypothetical protein
MGRGDWFAISAPKKTLLLKGISNHSIKVPSEHGGSPAAVHREKARISSGYDSGERVVVRLGQIHDYQPVSERSRGLLAVQTYRFVARFRFVGDRDHAFFGSQVATEADSALGMLSTPL